MLSDNKENKNNDKQTANVFMIVKGRLCFFLVSLLIYNNFL